MAKTHFLSLLLLLVLSMAAAAPSLSMPTTRRPTKFLITSCNATTYPQLCLQSLSIFSYKIRQSPRQLTQTALTVSLSAARSAEKYVSRLAKLRGLKKQEYSALADCVEEMGDTVDRLRQSVAEMKTIGKTKGKEIRFHMGNVETWVSAAITDETTCVDGFAGKVFDGKVKGLIRARCVDVGKVTSNALALVNRYASRH